MQRDNRRREVRAAANRTIKDQRLSAHMTPFGYADKLS